MQRQGRSFAVLRALCRMLPDKAAEREASMDVDDPWHGDQVDGAGLVMRASAPDDCSGGTGRVRCFLCFQLLVEMPREPFGRYLQHLVMVAVRYLAAAGRAFAPARLTKGEGLPLAFLDRIQAWPAGCAARGNPEFFR